MNLKCKRQVTVQYGFIGKNTEGYYVALDALNMAFDHNQITKISRN